MYLHHCRVLEENTFHSLRSFDDFITSVHFIQFCTRSLSRPDEILAEHPRVQFISDNSPQQLQLQIDDKKKTPFLPM